MARTLRHGYTTGACAAAAARGAALMLRGQCTIDEVELELPAGETVRFPLHGQRFSGAEAACFVVKDAGDDPDVTNGAEVHARVSLSPLPEDEGNVTITGGAGIGRVTKPGLAVPPGEWAINPVPRRMIAEAVRGVFPKEAVRVEISIPDGEELAMKTLNARLGIIGGLSILGTTGIVRPVSAKAWTDTIDAALDVARACGAPTVVLSTGRSSEQAAQAYVTIRRVTGDESNAGNRRMPDCLPEEAFVMMGDHVAHALSACAGRGFERPLIACQFAKLLKIACGHVNTHAAASELDLAALRQWAEAERLPPDLIGIIAGANTARELIIACGFDRRLLELACSRAQDAAQRHAPSLRPAFLVTDYAGNVVFHSR